MVCSICGSSGHNRRTCPTLTTPQRPQRMPQIPQRPQQPPNPNPSLILNQNTINSIISQLTAVVGTTPPFPILSAVASPQTNRSNQNSSNLHMPPSSHLPRPVHLIYPTFINSTNSYIVIYRITDENKLKFVTNVYENSELSHYVNYTVGWELIGTDVTLDENIDYDFIKETFASQILFAKTFVIHKQRIHIEEIDESKQWKQNAIKMKYLLDQMVNLGANDEKVYPNLAPIMDLVQDIDLPDYDQLDRENAGVPSTLTNVD